MAAYDNIVVLPEGEAGKRLSAALIGDATARTTDVAGGAKFPHVLSKTSATAPQSNTAADAPLGAGDFCIHYNAAGVYQAVYVCSAYVSTSSFTWTKITT